MRIFSYAVTELRRMTGEGARQTRMNRAGRFLSMVLAITTIVQTSSLAAILRPSVALAAVANPSLQQTCGLDISLAVDRSGSMNSTEMGQVKTAFSNFATAFQGTPTVFSLTSYSTDATLDQAFSRTPAQMAQDINSIPSTGSGDTNWDAGLARSAGTFDPRPANSNVIVMATDGSPNRWGDPAIAGFSYSQGLSHAITRADAIKTAGIRIVVIAIGSDTQDPDYNAGDPTWNNPKLTAISGPNIATTSAQITAATDVIKVADFTDIGAALASYSQALCPGSVTVHKQVDSDFDNRYEGDDAAANQLGFRWTLDGGSQNLMGDTASAQPGSHDVNEVLVGGYKFVGWYYQNNQNGGACDQPQTLQGTTLPINLSVSPQQNTSIVLCNQIVPATLTVNKQFDDTGDGIMDRTNPAGWTWDVQGGVQDSAGGATLTMLPGSYTVTEDVIGGYSSGWNCSNQTTGSGTSLSVALTSGQAVTCTFSNMKQTTNIALDKTGPASINPGQQMTYNLAWSVSGNTPATNAVISDTLPANTVFVSASNGGTLSGSVATWNLGTQNPGASGTVSLTVAVASTLTSATNLVNIASFDTDQTTPVSDSVTTNVLIPQVLGVTAEPALAIKKTVLPNITNPGKTVTYTVEISNPGNATAVNVVVTDTLPAGFKFVDTGRSTKSWTFATLAAGAKKTITYDVVVGATVKAGQHKNHATAMANGVDPVSASAKVTVKIPVVLGLATTGVGLQDYLIFMVGLSLLATGVLLTRRYQHSLV